MGAEWEFVVRQGELELEGNTPEQISEKVAEEVRKAAASFLGNGPHVNMKDQLEKALGCPVTLEQRGTEVVVTVHLSVTRINLSISF